MVRVEVGHVWEMQWCTCFVCVHIVLYAFFFWDWCQEKLNNHPVFVAKFYSFLSWQSFIRFSCGKVLFLISWQWFLSLFCEVPNYSFWLSVCKSVKKFFFCFCIFFCEVPNYSFELNLCLSVCLIKHFSSFFLWFLHKLR